MRILLVPLALFAGLISSGCVIRNNCTANNCNGCCDATGMCLDGTTADACGVRGAMCSACMSGVCASGVCSTPGVGGGVSGGGAAGGGTAGGVTGPTFGVNFFWNFAGQTCAQAGVSNVTISAPGATGGTFRCNQAGTDGAVVPGFPAGSYTVTLEGRDGANQVRFRGTSAVQVVNQDVSAQVRLEPVAVSGPGDLVVKWSLPALAVSPTPTCAQATITKVSVAVNGGTPRELNCSVGEPIGMGATFSNLSGTVRLDLSAADMNGFVYFRKQETVVISGTTRVTVALDWDVGSLPVRWEFRETTMARTCQQVGATSIFLNLRTMGGTLLYPGAGAEVPCTDAMTGQATVFPYLPQGTFDVFFQAVGTGGRLFKTDQMSPPRVTVRPGQFPQLDAMTPTYILTP
jgi:hypothetical protein